MSMSPLMLSLRVGMPGASRFLGSVNAGVVVRLVKDVPTSSEPMKRWSYLTPTVQFGANIHSKPVPTTPPNLTREALSESDAENLEPGGAMVSRPLYLLSVTATPPSTYQSSGPKL